MYKKLLLTALSTGMLFANTMTHYEEEHLKTDQKLSVLPEISLIMDTSFVKRDISDDEAKHLGIPGIAHGFLISDENDAHAHAKNNENNGFNLNYAELLISQKIEDILEIQAIFHFTETGVAIDELYFDTHALGYGTKIRAGKFRSDFGYLNKYHHHAYNFADMPLVYESFLGYHGLNENGFQLQWRASTPFELMIGAEILQGDNEIMFSNKSIELNTTTLLATDAPSLYVAYLKTSFDIDGTSVLAGLSFAHGATRLDHLQEEDPYAFSGNSTLYGLEFLVDYHLDNEACISWHNEILSRDMDGDKYNFDGTQTSLKKEQTGLYSELLYTYNEHLKFGARYENIFQNDIRENGIFENLPDSLTKQSIMIEYSPTEIAKFRLQYNHNSALYDEDLKAQNINSIILQANITIGTHPSHKEHGHDE